MASLAAWDAHHSITVFDDVRFRLLALAAAPTDLIRSEAPPRRQALDVLRRDLARKWRAWERAATSGAPGRATHVLSIDPQRRFAIIAAGRADGARRGRAVSAGGVLIGIVDRTESSMSRIRMLPNRSTWFGARIDGSGDASPRNLLLQGAWRGVARAARGSVIPTGAIGQPVYSVAATGIPGGLLIGWVDHDDTLGETVVRLVDVPDSIDGAEVHGADETRGGSLTHHAVVHSRVIVPSRRGGPDRTLLVGAGSDDGVRPGAWVSSGGFLIGRVVRTGDADALVAPIDAGSVPVDAIIVAVSPEPMARRLTFDAARDADAPVAAVVFARGGADLAPRGKPVAIVAERGGVRVWRYPVAATGLERGRP